jgi:hypothetical protein
MITLKKKFYIFFSLSPTLPKFMLIQKIVYEEKKKEKNFFFI